MRANEGHRHNSKGQETCKEKGRDAGPGLGALVVFYFSGATL